MVDKHRPSILVIDSDPDYLDIIKLGLSSEFDVTTVGSFHILKSEIQKLRPSVILLDKGLGEIGPKEILFFLKGLDFLKNIPVYLLSGNNGDKPALKKLASAFDPLEVRHPSFRDIRKRLHLILKWTS